MYVSALSSLASYLSLLLILAPSASAMCCRPDIGGDCDDNSGGTPCCGYSHCNGFCCACKGVQLIRQEVWITTIPHVAPSLSTATITADCGVTWTCRQDHVTRNTPTSQCGLYTSFTPAAQRAEATSTGHHLPGISGHPSSNIFRKIPTSMSIINADMANCQKIWAEVAGLQGTTIDLSQYLGFFGLKDTSPDDAYRQSVIDKFHRHDANGDGVLSNEEVMAYDPE